VRSCKHPSWEEVGRTYTAPPTKLSLGSGTPELILQVTYGITNIEMRCSACGDRKVVATPGKVDRP
jgi:hypothetical protein